MSSFGIGAQLVWESGERLPFALNKVITTLGRNEANDIFLDDPKVSSFHGNILNREDGYHLLDLKSRNGTQDSELDSVHGWQWVQRVSLSTALGAYLFSLIASSGE